MDHILKTESEIRAKYQITIPEDIRKKANLNIGDKLIWQYDEVRSEITVMPRPKSFTDKLWGLGKEIWENESFARMLRGGGSNRTETAA
jgi:bifunctional DNA-binding transcriptional regulator/antitoxin component of YhaV-PrlF toxin-antitoxin module